MSNEIKRITVDELHAAFKAQGVPSREDIAVKCPICGTVQSLRSLVAAGAGKTPDEAERFIGFSCVGRWTNAGPHRKGSASGKGCDWTLGGFFKLHNLIVIDHAGAEHPYFDLASPDEAQTLAARASA
ncbi:hypothetical protein SAMN02745157_0676 [Kaistia soli DSM 19436]|uniref:Uncharacterized protein n=1 Tax=Kaistia soli DSM 19436 TaxID=1122133 RepID=A0A1M4VDS5_9HYPH|nr:VVA0879 family protein [Kaistia soli]SHE67000.1 hypothetical protein SAMN02745157_0676 [Kaistia soli DSM 19436]